MAASVTHGTVRAAASPAAHLDGERLFAADAVGRLEPGYGGYNAEVTDGSAVWPVWVGLVDRALTGECDCPSAQGAGLCPHTVATALAVVDAGAGWSTAAVTGLPSASSADLPSSADASSAGLSSADPAEAAYLALAESLGPAELAALVARHAVHNRLLADELLISGDRSDG